MSISPSLAARSNNQCELCGSHDNLQAHIVSPRSGQDLSEQIALCAKCTSELSGDGPLDGNHWRCLNESMWSTEPAVQVMSYRLLHRLSKDHGWAQEARDMMYMEDEVRTWAQQDIVADEDKVLHKDSNGNVLQEGDSVTLIKDLNVKGANFTAKRGTLVKKIHLDPDNAQYIEGSVDGQKIVIITDFVKKA